MTTLMRAVRRPARARCGQVLIEVLLMLPVFMMLVFTVFEVAHLAARAIILDHAAYEAARIGSLTAADIASPSCPPPVLDTDKITNTAHRLLPRADVLPYLVPTLVDPQEGCRDYDVLVVLKEQVPLIFPLTGYILSNTRAKNDRYRLMEASVRMPIERPLYK